MKNLYILSLSAVLACVTLTGCGNVKEQLGITRDAPDEFAVMTRAPLEMPSSLALPPPQPGALRPQEKTPETRAKEAVFGSQHIDATASSQSSAESLILNKAGEQSTDPNIRTIVEQDARDAAKNEKTVAQKLLGLGGKKVEPTANVVDAKAEAQRIQDNIKSGKPVTEGETPSVKK